MAIYGGQYTVTGTATNVTTALTLSADRTKCKDITIRAASANAAKVYLGPSTVTAVPANAFAFLNAGDSWNSGVTETNSSNADSVYIIGNAGDIVFIEMSG